MVTNSPSDIPSALREAMAEMQKNPARALEIARTGLAQSSPDARFHIVAGQASRILEDWTGLEEAADGLLAATPEAILGLIWKGDCFSKRSELRQASAHYAAAKRVAAAASAPLPEATVRDLERVDRELHQIRRIYSFHLEDELRKKGITADNTSRAFAEAFATLAGAHQPTMERQRPTMLYFPGLPQRAYYEREEFDWAEGLEHETGAIREELKAVLADVGEFGAFVEGPATGADFEDDAKDDGGLSAYSLWAHGEPVADHLALCPETAAALETVPQPDFPGRCPVAAFWRLSAGVKIPERHGMLNSRLVCHLPLIASDGSGVVVDGERRQWTAGELVIFDDSVLHEVFNDSNEDAVVLLFDVARPEIEERDMKAIAALFEAVDSFR